MLFCVCNPPFVSWCKFRRCWNSYGGRWVKQAAFMWCLVWKNSSLRNVYLLLTTFLLKWNHKGINFKCNFREVLAPLWIKSCWCWLELEKSVAPSDRLSGFTEVWLPPFPLYCVSWEWRQKLAWTQLNWSTYILLICHKEATVTSYICSRL